jgi:chorismate mutase
MGVRGIRGAITVDNNTREAICQAAQLLLEEMVARNQVLPEDIASVLITATEDLDAAFPAQAARALSGWDYVPLMCAREIPVPGSLPHCLRVMMLVNTEKQADEIRHVFLRDAVKLRPDLANK